MSDYVFYAKYAKYNQEKGRRETWSETVNRVFDMHQTFLKNFLKTNNIPDELQEYLDLAKLFVKQKRVLGSQRALQFGGEPILKKNAKIYNCSATYVDRVRAFQEILYLLLCGCGVGASVQKHHIAKLPNITKHTKGKCRWVIDDSIEGWADALGVLMQSYFEDGQTGDFDESIIGKDIEFDYSRIRPAGAMISGGFLAPGPDGLHQSLDKIKLVIENRLSNNENRLHPIDVYDILMHSADAVLSGGVRRSASIIIFSKDDEEMLKAKTGNWFEKNPQRGRSNNSVLIKRDECTEEEFFNIIKNIKEFGEPGFVFADDYETMVNPCCLTGDSNISTDKGDIKMVDLVKRINNGEKIKALSYDEINNKLSYEDITFANKTRKNAQIIELTYIDENNNEKSLKCTPDHKIFTKNRGYIEAKDLTEDDIILMK